MSLKEKWDEYRAKIGNSLNTWESELAQRAFYVGAEAALKEPETEAELYAEIDHFRSHK